MSPDTGSLGREFCFGTANSTKLEHLRHTPESDGNQLLVALLYLPNNFLALQDLKMHAVFFPLSEVMEMSFQYNLGLCWNVCHPIGAIILLLHILLLDVTGHPIIAISEVKDSTR
jgi:hypothetical protein